MFILRLSYFITTVNVVCERPLSMAIFMGEEMKIGNHETFTKPNRHKEMFSSFLYLSNCFKWTDSVTSCLFSSGPQIRGQMCL